MCRGEWGQGAPERVGILDLVPDCGAAGDGQELAGLVDEEVAGVRSRCRHLGGTISKEQVIQKTAISSLKIIIFDGLNLRHQSLDGNLYPLIIKPSANNSFSYFIYIPTQSKETSFM